MLPCSSPPSQLRYRVSSGRFTPSCWSRVCTALGDGQVAEGRAAGITGEDLAGEEYDQAEQEQREDHQA